MTTPSISLSVHDRYTPELRDRIAEKIRTAMSSPEPAEYRLLTPAHLRALREIVSTRGPIVSLYLQLGPKRRTGHGWQSAFDSMTTQTLKGIEDRHEREALRSEFDRIEQALTEELPELGRGVAFFVCKGIDLWQRYPLSITLPDGIHRGDRPYVRPLVRTCDEHDRFVLAVLSRELSRFFISQIGQVEEVLQIKGQDLRQMLTDRVADDRRDFLETAAIKVQVKILAHAASLIFAAFEGRHLLPSGTPELRSAFARELSKEMQQHLGADFAVELHAGASAVTEAATPTQLAIEEREELATLQRMIEAGPHAAAWGEQPTFDALRLGQVLTLVVDDAFTKSGARCSNCGALLATVPAHCPVCMSDQISAIEDVAELAIDQALDERSALESIRSEAARKVLAERGPMAALLRW